MQCCTVASAMCSCSLTFPMSCADQDWIRNCSNSRRLAQDLDILLQENKQENNIRACLGEYCTMCAGVHIIPSMTWGEKQRLQCKSGYAGGKAPSSAIVPTKLKLVNTCSGSADGAKSLR